VIDPRLVWQYLSARFNLGADRDDHGVVTTELAVVVFLLVGTAILVVGLIAASAEDNANSLPVPQRP
jgi:hypothetical protein